MLNIHLIFNVSGFMICPLENFFSFSNGNTMVAEAMVLKADFGYLGIFKASKSEMQIKMSSYINWGVVDFSTEISLFLW